MTKPASAEIRVSVVIPAYNEELGIGEVVQGVHAAFRAAKWKDGERYEVLVVDDGSTDRTADIAARAGARVLRHPANGGYGRALLTGFEQARFEWLMMIDGDGSYPPEEMLKLLPHAPAFDLVIGAREGSFFWGTPLHAFLRRVYLSLASFVAGVRIPDANSGLRLIRKTAALGAMPILCYGYSLSTTMTLAFMRGGLFVTFVPVAYRLRKGRSKVRAVRDIPRTLQIMTQVIIYFNPLKFAAVLSLVPALFGAAFAVRGDLAMVCFCSFAALLVFLCGCLMDSIRLHYSSRSPCAESAE